MRQSWPVCYVLGSSNNDRPRPTVLAVSTQPSPQDSNLTGAATQASEDTVSQTNVDPEPDLVKLSMPVGGLPLVITTDDALAKAAAALRGAVGPVALDAERASGHRYGQRAYLIQIRRAGAGTFLIDPVAQPDLHIIDDAIAEAPWVLHAASQDLACLAEVGLEPRRGLFDTEIAARLLGRPRVGLAALVADYMGFALAKEHSAVDWSTRPLPESWLAYAALDVELLLELAEKLEVELEAAGRVDWLRQECEHTIAQSRVDAAPKPEPWRRTSGLHKIRGRKGLAVVALMWEERDRIARIGDVHPSRILPDAAIIAAATNLPMTMTGLTSLPEFATRGAGRHIRTWLRCIQQAAAAPEASWPLNGGRGDTIPQPRSWAQREPEAWARLEKARAGLSVLAEQLGIPVENLIKPDTVRRLCWEPPADAASGGLEGWLSSSAVRPWQIEQTLGILRECLN